MWRDPYFLVSFIYWICYLFFLVYLMFKGRRTPQIWQDKIRQVLAGWDKGGTVLVLGSPYNMGPITFAEEVSLSNKAEDTLFVSINKFKWWFFEKTQLAALVCHFLSLGIPTTHVIAHKLTGKFKAIRLEDDDAEKAVSSEEEEEPVVQYNQLPFDTNSMDVVLSCDILRTGPRKNKEFFEECLAESLRVIKPGGRAIVMTVDSTFRRRSKKIKAYLEQAEIEFTVERHDGSVWYDITKPVSEKYIV
ncbi:hypothetical protein FRB91_005004 [Serendipita sp. 411]|nr:hypothetical protein FRB91_005004 [Serendipita sp. 411]